MPTKQKNKTNRSNDHNNYPTVKHTTNNQLLGTWWEKNPRKCPTFKSSHTLADRSSRPVKAPSTIQTGTLHTASTLNVTVDPFEAIGAVTGVTLDLIMAGGAVKTRWHDAVVDSWSQIQSKKWHNSETKYDDFKKNTIHNKKMRMKVRYF